MATIELNNIGHYYEKILTKKDKGSFNVENLNMKWEHGSANALLGPSGCGKTTLLNIVSGLLTPKAGQVLFDGEDVTFKSAKERHISQVFQFPVVYDSMNVFGNLAFPLRNDGLPESKIKARVFQIAEILELTDILNYSVGKLTPADKQKISLGRGIVRDTTAAVLLDEPLTVIDPKLQWNLRRKLKLVQKELDVTMIYVTHDQHEALTFAENVTVMSNGMISQTGSPEELHTEPASPFVGYFIGSPGMNLLDCILKEDSLGVNGFKIKISPELKSKIKSHGNDFQFGIRPEYVKVSKEPKDDWIPANVLVTEDTGAYLILTITMDHIKMKCRAPEALEIVEDEQIWIHFPEERMLIFKDDKKIN